MWLFGKKKKREDSELLRLYLDTGNKAVFGELFEKHVKDVYGACFFYFRNRARAEDAVMQIFEKLMDDLRKHDVKNFRAWLACVVRNHCISQLRKNKDLRFLPETYLDFEIRIADEAEEQRIAGVDADLMLSLMRSFIPLLKEKQRICLEHFYLGDRSYQEISDNTGYPLNEVRSCIQNAKRNLKLMISEHINKQDENRQGK